ncbi:MAG: RecQ family ATP-dependent DNA helicase [Armatimonadetes bacterium]|nr:RecQ family ATP-dependent DNA helicase [Armatimonadota bacterium]
MATESLEQILHRVWGFDELRPLQQRAVDLTVAGADSLVVMPTGGGKSLCFQLPPLVDGGFTLVVSPLISLMADQVQGLRLVGYPAEALHSGMSSEEVEATNIRVLSGETRLLYVSPERVLTSASVSLLKQANNGAGVARIAIDEAHCISAWGHDFRPEYRVLSRLREHFPSAPIQALTATATPKVRDDIAAQLQLREPEYLIGNFDRPNLVYRVVPKSDPIRQVATAIQRHPRDAAIVYCISRKDTEEMAMGLNALGINASAYHAGLSSEQRAIISEDFAMERLHVVVATVAFGMGIDRSNVRCVIHASLPKSIEGYQQETGRAGRDGLPSECITLFSQGDIVRWNRVLMGASPELEIHQKQLLDEIRRFATAIKCRHQSLVEYFGQEYDGPMPCGACDVCEDAPELAPNSTLTAQKILATVREMQQKKPELGFGLNHIVGILRGADTKQIRAFSHQELRGYGCLKAFPVSRITSWIQQLMDLEFLGQTSGKYPTVFYTEAGAQAMLDRIEVNLYNSQSVGGSTETETSIAKDDPLFEVLRGVRREFAEAGGVPAWMILPDATLIALAGQRPTSSESLLGVSGIGEKKAAEFGPKLLEVISEYCRQNNLPTDLAAKKTVKKNVASGKLTATALVARPLFERGNSIAEIMETTGRASSTIMGYLAEWIEETAPESVSAWIDDSTLARVQEAVKIAGDGALRPIYEELKEEVPYDQIRTAIAFFRAHSE